MTVIQQKRQFFSIFFVLGLILVPHFSHANYSFNGKTFDTYEDMQSYVTAYMEAWREVYGKNTDEPKSSSVLRDNTQRRSNDISVHTAQTRNVAYNSARLIGTIDFKRSDKARIWFDYGYAKNRLVFRSSTQVLNSAFGDQSFDIKVFNLIPETTYYYRAGAINEDGDVDYGEIKTFTTDVDTETDTSLVRARTYSATDIDNNRAQLRGTLSPAREAIAYTWFTYGEDEDDLYEETPKRIYRKGDARRMEETITRLADSETYYFRFHAMDSFGEISYGDIRSFKTKVDIENEKPELETLRASDIGVHSASLHGEIDMNDFRDGIAFFVYGEDKTVVREVAQKYDEYEDIRERGDDLQKVFLDIDTDRYKRFSYHVRDLDAYTRYYYAIGVEYENEDNDEEILLGRIYSLQTKRDN
jgi:hypothetical protein